MGGLLHSGFAKGLMNYAHSREASGQVQPNIGHLVGGLMGSKNQGQDVAGNQLLSALNDARQSGDFEKAQALQRLMDNHMRNVGG